MGGGGARSGGRTGATGRLRRGLLGVKPADVERELAARDAEIEELRKELAALWQTYAQHDRAIREALTPPPIAADAADSADAADVGSESAIDAPTPAERRAGIEAQLSGLDEALAAIEQATQTLEQAYRPPSAEAGGEGSPPPPSEAGR